MESNRSWSLIIGLMIMMMTMMGMKTKFLRCSRPEELIDKTRDSPWLAYCATRSMSISAPFNFLPFLACQRHRLNYAKCKATCFEKHIFIQMNFWVSFFIQLLLRTVHSSNCPLCIACKIFCRHLFFSERLMVLQRNYHKCFEQSFVPLSIHLLSFRCIFKLNTLWNYVCLSAKFCQFWHILPMIVCLKLFLY